MLDIGPKISTQKYNTMPFHQQTKFPKVTNIRPRETLTTATLPYSRVCCRVTKGPYSVRLKIRRASPSKTCTTPPVVGVQAGGLTPYRRQATYFLSRRLDTLTAAFLFSPTNFEVACLKIQKSSQEIVKG